MRESVTYQAVLEEGREEGREEAERSLILSLLQEDIDLDLIARVTGWSIEKIIQLQRKND